MAEIRLGLYEIQSGHVPAICALCGQPATSWVKRKFTWRRSELISIGNPERKMIVNVPMCQAHRNHWWRRVRFNLTYGGFLVLLFLGIFSFRGRNDDDVLGYACLAFMVLLGAWAIINLGFESGMIKPVEITERSIALKGVSESFVAAVTEARSKLAGQAKPPDTREKEQVGE